MKSVLLDSNIIIYTTNDETLIAQLRGKALFYSSISVIETLGYPDLTTREALSIQGLLQVAHHLDLDPTTINKATELRQRRRMSLGDAIVAATAITHDLELWTRNLKDFANLPELRLVDPFLKLKP